MPASSAPAHLGPYELIARLGSGGMAETFIAVRRGPGGFVQRVCLKRLRPELERDPEFIRQFMAEATLAARLRHAGITQVLDFGRDGDDYYMALELIDGLDLRELLEGAGGRLSADSVQYIATELATALDFAHRGGGIDTGDALVHRDVSTSNTLISTEGEVKLTDFGIARSLVGPKHTRTGIVKGKVPYMAPEYARSGRLDARADLFSLGVLLYECLCGARPHDGETDLQTLERASRGDHPPLGVQAPDVPRPLAELVEQLLEPDPELRIQTAGALLESLLALPAPTRARRELGARVVELRRGRPSPVAPAPLPPTEPMRGLDPAVAPTVSASGPTTGELASELHGPAPTRRALLVLGAALLFAGGVAALALTRAAPPPAAEATPAAVDAPAAAAELMQPAPPVGSAGNAAPTPATATGSSPAAPAPARLEVVVLPFGEVSVDGRARGSAPVTVQLRPGTHTVEATSQGRSVARRKVTLTPGQHKQIVLQ